MEDVNRKSESGDSKFRGDDYTLGTADFEMFLTDLAESYGNDAQLVQLAKQLLESNPPNTFTVEKLVSQTMESARGAAMERAGADLMNRCMR
jgi:hypothetical protein